MRIIYVTGTPGTGKTEVATLLAKRLKGKHINLGRICLEKGYVKKSNQTAKSPIINLNKITQHVKQIISKKSQPLIFDAHFTVKIPRRLKPIFIVLRCEPTELLKRLTQKRFNKKKKYENVWAEILDFCLQETLAFSDSVYEIDTTGKKAENVVGEIQRILRYKKKPIKGICDWIKTLEADNKLEKMLFLGEKTI